MRLSRIFFKFILQKKARRVFTKNRQFGKVLKEGSTAGEKRGGMRNLALRFVGGGLGSAGRGRPCGRMDVPGGVVDIKKMVGYLWRGM